VNLPPDPLPRASLRSSQREPRRSRPAIRGGDEDFAFQNTDFVLKIPSKEGVDTKEAYDKRRQSRTWPRRSPRQTLAFSHVSSVKGYAALRRHPRASRP